MRSMINWINGIDQSDFINLPVLSFSLKPLTIVLLVVLVVMIALIVFLYIYGSKMQKKQKAAQEQMQVGAQTVSLLVIDKKRMKLKEAGFPDIVLKQTPKYLRGSKVPVVKAKIGPKIMTLMCEDKVFDLIPVKKEVKVVMNGIYIMDVKGARGGLEERKEKVGFFKRMANKASEMAKENIDNKNSKSNNSSKGNNSSKNNNNKNINSSSKNNNNSKNYKDNKSNKSKKK